MARAFAQGDEALRWINKLVLSRWRWTKLACKGTSMSVRGRSAPPSSRFLKALVQKRPREIEKPEGIAKV